MTRRATRPKELKIVVPETGVSEKPESEKTGSEEPVVPVGIPVIYDYDPTRDPPPGATGYRKGRTPRDAAKKLRAMWIGGRVFPLTFEQMVRQPPSAHYVADYQSKSGAGASGTVSAHEAVVKTAIEAGCSMQEAREACWEVMPELWADHWEAEWQRVYAGREAETAERKAEING